MGQPKLGVNETWFTADGQIEALADWIKLTGDAMLLAASSETSAGQLMEIQQRRVALHSLASVLVGLKKTLQKGDTHGNEQR